MGTGKKTSLNLLGEYEDFGLKFSWKIWIALFTIYIVWGSTYLAITFAIETIPPFLMAAFRFLLAGSILFLWRRVISKDPGPIYFEWKYAAVIGLFLLLGGNGGVVWAETRVTSGVAALIIATTPLWMVIFDLVRKQNRKIPSIKTVFGLVIGFIGIFILIGPQQILGNQIQMDPAGVSALLLAAIFWSIGSLYSRKAKLPPSPLLGTGMEMLIGGLGLLVLGTISGEWARLQITQISVKSIAGLVYLILFGAIIGFSAYTWLLRNAPTPLVSTYAFVNPLIAILLGHFLANESLTPRILIAALVIVSSIFLINTSRVEPNFLKNQANS